jgi:thiol:disulfide interchange protein
MKGTFAMQSEFHRLVKVASTFAFVLFSSLAAASGQQPYEAGAFKAAQAAGKPVLVEIHADWCTECKMQNQVLSKLTREAAYAGVVRFRVDFDKQKDVVKAFGARKQSTLVIYKGDKEVGRAVGITGEDRIKALLNKAI